MPHFSENSQTLEIMHSIVTSREELLSACRNLTDVCVITLPASQNSSQLDRPLKSIGELIADASKHLGETATLVVIGEVIDLIQVQAKVPDTFTNQLWIAIKRKTVIDGEKRKMPHQHFGALVYTRYKASLRHTRTRIEYTYCPVCDKTTKDYGGKKHTYHEAGTLISDVWRDIACDLDGDLSLVIKRLADLFGLKPYKTLSVIDIKQMGLRRQTNPLVHIEFQENQLPQKLTNIVLKGDCLEELRKIPDNSDTVARLPMIVMGLFSRSGEAQW